MRVRVHRHANVGVAEALLVARLGAERRETHFPDFRHDLEADHPFVTVERGRTNRGRVGDTFRSVPVRDRLVGGGKQAHLHELGDSLRRVQLGLFVAWDMLKGSPTTLKTDTTIHHQTASPASLELALLEFLAGGVEGVHTLTLADASLKLWQKADETQRIHLLAYLGQMSRARGGN